jgi:hypothetical protein
LVKRNPQTQLCKDGSLPENSRVPTCFKRTNIL